MFFFKRQRDSHGRFVKGHTPFKRKVTDKIISPVDIAREQFLQIQPQFFEHDPPKEGIMNVFMMGDLHYLNSKLQRRPQKMINLEPIGFVKTKAIGKEVRDK